MAPEAIAVVFGEPAPVARESVEAAPPLYLRQCDWTADAGEFGSRSVFLSITTSAGLAAGGAGGEGYSAADLYADTLLSDADAVSVAGLGEQAFFTNADEQELHVLQGDTNLTISALTLGSESAPITGDQLRELIETAVARL